MKIIQALMNLFKKDPIKKETKEREHPKEVNVKTIISLKKAIKPLIDKTDSGNDISLEELNDAKSKFNSYLDNTPLDYYQKELDKIFNDKDSSEEEMKNQAVQVLKRFMNEQ